MCRHRNHEQYGVVLPKGQEKRKVEIDFGKINVTAAGVYKCDMKGPKGTRYSATAVLYRA
jgi:hypothetical protein